MLCDLIGFTRVDIPSPDDPTASSGVIIFVRQTLFFFEFSTSPSLGLTFTLIMQGSTSHQITFPLSSYFINYASIIRSSSTDSRTNFFFLPIFLPPKNLFILGNFNCHHSFWDSIGTSAIAGRKYSLGSSLRSFPSITLTPLPFSMVILAVAPLLTSFCSSLSCSWKMLQDLGSARLPILLTVLLSPLFRHNK